MQNMCLSQGALPAHQTYQIAAAGVHQGMQPLQSPPPPTQLTVPCSRRCTKILVVKRPMIPRLIQQQLDVFGKKCMWACQAPVHPRAHPWAPTRQLVQLQC